MTQYFKFNTLASEIQTLNNLQTNLQALNERFSHNSCIEPIADTIILSLQQDITITKIFQHTKDTQLLNSSLDLLTEYNQTVTAFINQILSSQINSGTCKTIHLLKSRRFSEEYVEKLKQLNKHLMIIFNCANVTQGTRHSKIENRIRREKAARDTILLVATVARYQKATLSIVENSEEVETSCKSEPRVYSSLRKYNKVYGEACNISELPKADTSRFLPSKSTLQPIALLSRSKTLRGNSLKKATKYAHNCKQRNLLPSLGELKRTLAKLRGKELLDVKANINSELCYAPSFSLQILEDIKRATPTLKLNNDVITPEEILYSLHINYAK